MISNIYLVLILLLVLLIIFLIYQSHQYTNVETFAVPEITMIKENNPIQIDSLPKNLLNFDTVINNKITIDKNKKILDTDEKTSQNLKRLEELKRISRLYTNVNPDFPPEETIKTIKSNYNSQLLSTKNVDVNKYNIIANNKCLTVAGLCPGEFCLQDCQKGIYSSNSQRFKSERISNVFEAAKAMNIDISLISDKNEYPFNIFRSDVNGKCLTSTNNGIIVNTCNLNNTNQQWKISPDENMCKLE